MNNLNIDLLRSIENMKGRDGRPEFCKILARRDAARTEAGLDQLHNIFATINTRRTIEDMRKKLNRWEPTLDGYKYTNNIGDVSAYCHKYDGNMITPAGGWILYIDDDIQIRRRYLKDIKAYLSDHLRYIGLRQPALLDYI